MKSKRTMRKTCIAMVTIIVISLVWMSGCAKPSEKPSDTKPDNTAASEATDESSEVADPTTVSAETTASSAATTTAQAPELIMTDWSVNYFPEDQYGSLEAYTFIIGIESAKPIPEGYGLSVDFTLTTSDGDVLTGEAGYYGNIRFAGLQKFSLAFTCHSFKNEPEILEMLSGIEEMEANFRPTRSGSSGSEDTPFAYVELSADDMSFESDAFGIRSSLLKFENKGYLDFGECVFYVRGRDNPMVIHVGKDLDDFDYLSGYTDTTVDLSKVETVFYCVNDDVALEIG